LALKLGISIVLGILVYLGVLKIIAREEAKLFSGWILRKK